MESSISGFPGMDFHALKRKKLQALCKKNKIAANLKNVEMADRLASLSKVNDEKPTEQLVKPCLKNLEQFCDEGKEHKTVRFSRRNDTFVFEKTDLRAVRAANRRRSSITRSEDRISKERNLSTKGKGSKNSLDTQTMKKGVKKTRYSLRLRN